MIEEPKAYTTDIDLWWNTIVSYNLIELAGIKRDEILEYINQIIEYIDVFMLMPVIKFENNVVSAKSRITTNGNFNEVIEFIKQEKTENEKVFLYMIYKTSDTWDKTQYIIRYSTIEQV